MPIRGRPPTGYTKEGPLKRKVVEAVIREKGMSPLKYLEDYVYEKVVAAFESIGYNMLFDAVNACPYETGMLRRSARGDVKMAGGGIRNILYVPEADESGYFEIKERPVNISRLQKARSPRMSLYLSFNRMNEMGHNIAVWTHEELLPFSQRKKRSEFEEQTGRSPLYFATKPGTGPKYLENAIAKYHNELRATIYNHIHLLKMRINQTYRDEMPKARTVSEVKGVVRTMDRKIKTDTEKVKRRTKRKSTADIRRDLGLPTELQEGRVKRRAPRLRRYKVRYKGGEKRRRYFRAPGKPPKA